MKTCIVEVDSSGRFIRVEEDFARRLGYKSETLIGSHFMDLVHAPLRSQIISIYLNAIKTNNRSVEIDTKLVCKDGSFVEIRAIPYFNVNDNGYVTSVTKVFFKE